MATTSNHLATDKTLSGERPDLKAKLARAAAILGCAATLTFGVVRADLITRTQPRPAAQSPQPGFALSAPMPADASTSVEFRWDFGEQRALPLGAPSGYRVSAPNERNPDGTSTVDR